MFFVSPGGTLHIRVLITLLIDPELLTELLNDGVVKSAFLYFFASRRKFVLSQREWLLDLVLAEAIVEGALEFG